MAIALARRLQWEPSPADSPARAETPAVRATA
jgi:hypothetical protein